MTYFSNCVMSNLVGKTVKALYVSDNQSRLVVVHNEGQAPYFCDSDCCSETWIADLVGVSSLLGQTVLKAENMDLPRSDVDDGRCRQDYDEFYGIKLLTSGGYVDIIYRNSSNGYYGGSLERDSAPVTDLAEMIEITEDYSA